MLKITHSTGWKLPHLRNEINESESNPGNSRLRPSLCNQPSTLTELKTSLLSYAPMRSVPAMSTESDILCYTECIIISNLIRQHNKLYRVAQKKCTKFNAPPFCNHVHSRITRFYQNAQILTGTTKNGRILNTVVKSIATTQRFSEACSILNYS